MRTAGELLKKLYELRTKYGERDERYLANWYAWKGEYDRIYENYSSDALALSRRRTERNIQKWNLVRPIVDTHRILVDQLPAIEVPAPQLGNQMAAMKAEKIERVLYALWDMMNMKRKHGEASFNLALNSATVLQAAWDDEKDIPVIYSRSPGETYPVMKRNGEEVSYCFFRWEEDTEELAERYPAIKDLLTRNRLGQYSHGKIEVVEFIDETERLMLVGGDVKSLLRDRKGKPEGGAHALKACPVVIASAVTVPGEMFPPGAVDQLVAMNDHLNRFQTKLGDAIEETLFGWHDIEGEGANEVALNTGAGAVNRLEGANLTHKYTQPEAPPAQAFGHVDQVQRYMRNLANWPETASGEMNSAIITGKAVTRLQGVMAAQAAATQSNLGEGLRRMNSICLQMMETYRGGKEFELYATEPVTLASTPGRKHNFSVTCIPEQDFQGYYQNTLHYSPFGSDMNASIQIGMQLVDGRIFPRSWLRNLIPGGSDAEGMAAEIREEDRERAIFEADLQVQTQERILEAQYQQQARIAALTQPQGATGGETPPAPDSGNAPLPPGGLAPSASPAGGGEMIGGNTMLMPGGQPQMMGLGEPLTGSAESFPIPYTPLKPYGPAVASLAGTGTHGAAANREALGGAPEGNALPGKTMVKAEDIVSALEQAVNRRGEKAIDKLKGRVYLMGELATRGSTDGKVEIGITVKSDQQIITTALPQFASQGLLVFRVITTPNPEEAVEIFGPAEEGVPEPVTQGV